MRFDSLELNIVVAFLSSVYLGSYWYLNMGNLNIFKERNPQACLTKGCCVVVTLVGMFWNLIFPRGSF